MSEMAFRTKEEQEKQQLYAEIRRLRAEHDVDARDQLTLARQRDEAEARLRKVVKHYRKDHVEEYGHENIESCARFCDTCKLLAVAQPEEEK